MRFAYEGFDATGKPVSGHVDAPDRQEAGESLRRRNIFELYIEEVVEACSRLKGGKLVKEKLKDQLQKIATKRTGGEKTDELLGHDGGGPEGLPHSIIVTSEGTEGDAPVLNGDEGSDNAPSEELPLDGEKSQALVRVKAKTKSAEATRPIKPKKTDRKNPAKIQPASAKQMMLGFETAETSAKRSQKIGKRDGAKKAKK